jgi:hypothetical protein
LLYQRFKGAQPLAMPLLLNQRFSIIQPPARHPRGGGDLIINSVAFCNEAHFENFYFCRTLAFLRWII